jgi:hypothetical protein
VAELYPPDRWLCWVRALTSPVHAEALILQSFTRLLLPAGCIGDIVYKAPLALLEKHGVALVTPRAVGQTKLTGEMGVPQFSFVAMLPHILVGGLGDGEGDRTTPPRATGDAVVRISTVLPVER